MARRRYTPKLKAQVCWRSWRATRRPVRWLRRTGSPELGRALEAAFHRDPEIFADETTVNEYERRLRDLEQLLGKKEVRAPKKFLGRERLSVKARVALVSGAREAHGLTAALSTTTTPGPGAATRLEP